MDASISPQALQQSLASNAAPLLIDVRRQPAFLDASTMIDGALRRDPGRTAQWAEALPSAFEVVVYCVHGHEVSQGAARTLREMGFRARYLEGGISQWQEMGGGVASKPRGSSTRWITRERPKIDRIACPWLIKRFVDPDAEFFYVPAAKVREIAVERGATPYDVAEVEFTHRGDRCSFDAFAERYRLSDPALVVLATIVRGADTDRLELAPQSAGLVAISLGLARLYADDLAMLGQGLIMYDALYAWCKHGKEEGRTWNLPTDR